MPDPGLQQEANDASVDFAVTYDSDAPLTRDQAFVAGFKAAAASRDQRIKLYESLLRMIQQHAIARVAVLPEDPTRTLAEYLAFLLDPPTPTLQQAP